MEFGNSIGAGFSGIYGIGAGSSIELQWVLHGPQASWKPALSVTQAVGGGYAIDGTINIGKGYYTGDVSMINRGMMVQNSGAGDFPAIWGSAAVSAGGNIGLTGIIAPQQIGGYVISGQLNIGAGLPAGPIPINAAGGVSNTWVLIDWGGK